MRFGHYLSTDSLINMIKKILKILFVVWIILWVNFIIRDLFVRGYFEDYKNLAKKNAEEKRSYAYGDYLFNFLEFSKKSLPEGANFGLVGIDELSLDGRRSIYYLYPYVKRDNPNFILVFKKAGFRKNGYKLYRKLDNASFILKRT